MVNKKILQVSSFILALSGFLMLFSVAVSFFSYETDSKKEPYLISPLSETSISKVAFFNDYTNPDNWFAKADEESLGLSKSGIESKVKFYTLDIPKLGIENAVVEIDGKDLKKTVIQYPGTALPGKKGNTVIFGHSILPIFYNPKDYLAIFSTLHTLRRGDEIKVNYDGLTYVFVVESVFEVLPTDLWVLSQKEDDSYISLITCAPPGHPAKPKRLVVKAKIKPLDSARFN